MPRHTVITAIVAALLTGCTIPLGSGTNKLPPPSEDADALDARLNRCAALGAKAAAADTDCQNAWAEARRRILPLPPSEK
jgi:conjugative transfer region protein TrbK